MSHRGQRPTEPTKPSALEQATEKARNSVGYWKERCEILEGELKIALAAEQPTVAATAYDKCACGHIRAFDCHSDLETMNFAPAQVQCERGIHKWEQPAVAGDVPALLSSRLTRVAKRMKSTWLHEVDVYDVQSAAIHLETCTEQPTVAGGCKHEQVFAIALTIATRKQIYWCRNCGAWAIEGEMGWVLPEQPASKPALSDLRGCCKKWEWNGEIGAGYCPTHMTGRGWATGKPAERAGGLEALVVEMVAVIDRSGHYLPVANPDTFHWAEWKKKAEAALTAAPAEELAPSLTVADSAVSQPVCGFQYTTTSVCGRDEASHDGMGIYKHPFQLADEGVTT